MLVAIAILLLLRWHREFAVRLLLAKCRRYQRGQAAGSGGLGCDDSRSCQANRAHDSSETGLPIKSLTSVIHETYCMNGGGSSALGPQLAGTGMLSNRR